MKAFLRLAPSIILALCCALLPAQDAPDSAVSLTIRFASGTSQFHVGEAIPIELSFSATAPRTFELNTRSYDRSGRLDLENFHVSPEGRDPLYNYFVGGVNRVFAGGGLYNIVYLGPDRYVMTEELNEWAVLEQPGHYSLYVTSSRVGRSGQSDTNPLHLKSNTLEFDIISADESWQQQTLAAAIAILDRRESTPEEKNAAMRALRFLDSPQSVHELVLRAGQPGDKCDWDCFAGLIGSTRQRLVVQELESRLTAPGVAVTSTFLSLLGQSKFMLEHGPMPPYPDGEKEQKQWADLEKKRGEEFETLQASLLAKATAVLQSKMGEARAETVRTLLQHSNNGEKPAGLRDSDLEDALLALPAEEQSHLLQYSWSRLKTPAIAQVLEKILERPKLDDHMLRGVALRRLDELDHEKAVAILFEEIRHPHPDLGIYNNVKEVLQILPDKPDPQFDTVLARRLEQEASPTFDLDINLIARLASPAILPRVKALYEKTDDDSCTTRGELVSYFLRVDPGYAMRHLKDASLFCMRAAWESAFRLKQWSAVEPFLIAELNGPNLWNARNAAETLERFGGLKAKRAMLERLRRFHQQWAKREKEFKSTLGAPHDVSEAMSFQYGLVEAIGKAQGWILEDSEIAEVQRLTLGNQKQQVADWESPHSEWIGIDVSMFSFDSFSILVDRYLVQDVSSLRAKLAQFPSGTHFFIGHFGSAQEDHRWNQVMQAIHEVAQEHEFKIDMGSRQ